MLYSGEIISGSRCPAQCRTWYSGEFTSSSGCSAGVGPPVGFHSHGVLGTCPDPPAWDPAVGTLVRTAPSITQVIAGPPEALIMGALLTSQVVDIAIGYMTLRGMEGRRARHRNPMPAIVTAGNTMALAVPGSSTEQGDITVGCGFC